MHHRLIILLLLFYSSCKTSYYNYNVEKFSPDSIVLTATICNNGDVCTINIDQVYLPKRFLDSTTNYELISGWLDTTINGIYFDYFMLSHKIAKPHFAYTQIDLYAFELQFSSDPDYLNFLRKNTFCNERVLLIGVSNKPSINSVLKPVYISPFTKKVEEELLDAYVPSSNYRLIKYSNYNK